MFAIIKKVLAFLARSRPRYSTQNTEMVFSSLFFSLALFTLLVIVFAKFASGLGELFKLVSQPYGVVFILTFILLCCCVIISFYSLVATLRNKPIRAFLPLSFLTLIVTLAYMALEIGYFSNIRTVEDPILVDLVPNNMPMELDFFIHDILETVFFVLFALLPVVMILCGYEFNKLDKWGRMLQLLRPNLNIPIATCFGLWIRPFDYSNSTSLLILIILALTLIGVLWCLVKTRQRVSFYEILNTILLLLGISILLSSQNILEDVVACYEFRRMFFALILLGWINGWVFKIITSTKRR